MAEKNKNEMVYLLHIMDAAERIAGHISGLSEQKFLDTPMVQDAVVRQIEILGEAAKHVSSATRERFSGIPWKLLAGMRDKLIHDYFDADISLVWETAATDIPAMKPKIEEVLSILKGAS